MVDACYMKILLTGCIGFIGSATVRKLFDAGHQVVGVDNLNHAYDPALKDWRRRDLSTLESEGFEFLELDITDRTAIDPVLDEGDFEAVINLAGRAGVRDSVVDPWVFYETNVTGVLNLLEGCRRNDIPRFLQASTSSLYGNNKTPFSEDDFTDRPLSPYAASKKAAEALCHSYHHLYGINTGILRFFTVYGPAGRPDLSIFRFIRWITEGQPVQIYGDGKQSRDFTYVEDIARGIVSCVGSDIEYEIINLGSDRPVSILELITKIGDLVRREPILEFQPAAVADVPATWADISKAADVLGWKPETDLMTGLSRTIDWYMANREMTGSVAL
jgi:UDP-glucuronate 4-epimerase